MRLSDFCREENREILIRQYEEIRKYLEIFPLREDELEEILQETMITVWRKISDLRDDTKIDQWARSIAKNKLKKLYKRKNRDLERNLSYDRYEGMLSESRPSLPEELIYHEMEGISNSGIFQLVMELGKPANTILILHYVYRENFTEIADTLKMNPNTVRSIAVRSRAKLEHKIEEGRMNHEE